MRMPLRVIALFSAAFPLLVGFTQACGGLSSNRTDKIDACNSDQDCVGGTCVFPGSCPGTCLPYRTQDESCGANVSRPDDGSCTVNGAPTPCAPDPVGECTPDSGLSCDPIAHRCLPTPPIVIAEAGQPCSIFGARCDTGLYCSGLMPTGGVCAPIVQDGGTCLLHNPGCADGLVCAGYGTAADAKGNCRVPALVGADCLTPTGSGTGNSGCQWPLQCVEGKCQEPPASGPCLNGVCQEDVAYCDQTTRTCQPLRADGAPCTAPAQCSHHWCDLTKHCGSAICPSH
ncbi:hypothetical protein [Labilithrix luteola]|uniref:hypothetical protein n=1 Tax=Labilithrix luteola TaxID=1391654 RepID=UPI0011BA57EE|nr:hypothetical protein [Labilithrix luteola]